MARKKQETNRPPEFCSRLFVIATIGIGLAVLTQAPRRSGLSPF
jgi:hypothetical protein